MQLLCLEFSFVKFVFRNVCIYLPANPRMAIINEITKLTNAVDDERDCPSLFTLTDVETIYDMLDTNSVDDISLGRSADGKNRYTHA